MPESAQAALLAIFLMPGLIGYLAFSSLYCREVEDLVAKISYIALFNVLSLVITGYFFDVSTVVHTDLSKLDLEKVITYTTHSLLTLASISLTLAIFIATILNTNALQKISLYLRITRKTGSGSILADTILSHPHAYLKFRFKNGSYIIGHPRRYSLHGDESCLFLGNAARRPAKTSPDLPQPPEAAIAGPGILILGFDEVLCVEVLEGGFS